MADLILFLIAILAKAPFPHIKQRVVAETVIAGQSISDFPLADPLGSQFRLIREIQLMAQI